MFVHDIVGRKPLTIMKNKPIECFLTEQNMEYADGDVVIATFPKTGTTVLQFMCHLIRGHSNLEQALDFDDIHQVSPHTSTAYLIDQNLNSFDFPVRIFKSHRNVSQIASQSKAKVKFISTIRDPRSTLISVFNFGKERHSIPSQMTLFEYANSSTWRSEYSSDTIPTFYDTLSVLYSCRQCENMLLIPYEDLILRREFWIREISAYLNILLTEKEVERIVYLTSKEEMRKNVQKFDESWVMREREKLNRHHFLITKPAAKVTSSSSSSSFSSDGDSTSIRVMVEVKVKKDRLNYYLVFMYRVAY